MTLFKHCTTALLVACGGLLTLTGCGGPAPSSETISGAPPAREMSQNKSYDDGTHIIYFNVINSDFITPDVAKQYNIVRSKNRALVNVSVHKKNPDNSTTSVVAALNDKVSNLTGQLKSVTWNKVNEGEAIYYIGQIPIANGETLIFDMKIIPQGHDDPIPVKFQQRLFTD